MIFDRDWFKRHQKKLLWFANTFVGRRFFSINSDLRIAKVTPNSIHFYDGGSIKAEFYSKDFFAKKLYKGFLPVWKAMHIWDSLIGEKVSLAPNFGFDTLEVYPEAHPESTSIDGFIETGGNGGEYTWAEIQAGGCGDYVDTENSGGNIRFVGLGSSGSDEYWQIGRGFFLFNTSDLEGGTVSAATLSIYSDSKENSLTPAPDLNIYSATPASNNNLVLADFDEVGSTAFSSALAYASVAEGGYNDFALNASGIANISTSGISKFSLRNANYDVANTEPAWAESTTLASIGIKFAEAGDGYWPKLSMTYTPSGVSTTTSSTSTSTSTTTSSTSSTTTSSSTSSSTSSTSTSTSTSSSTSSTSSSTSSTTTWTVQMDFSSVIGIFPDTPIIGLRKRRI